MNLIQIKQIDGLNASLDSLAASINNLDTELNDKIDVRDNFWNQIYFTTEQLIIDGDGESSDGESSISLVVEKGGLLAQEDSYFRSDLKVGGDLLLTNYTGQLVFLDRNSNEKRFSDALMPNHRRVETETLSSNDYVVGVNSSVSDASVTLPPPSLGQEITIKDETFNAELRNITVLPNSTETVDNSSSFTISGDGGFARFYSDGINWYLSAKDHNDLSQLVDSNHTSLVSDLSALESDHDSRIDYLESNSQTISTYTTGTLPIPSVDGTSVLATDAVGGTSPSMVYYYGGSWYRASDNISVAP